MSKDYYKTLGVTKNASSEEIKKAFRRIAHEHHPDKKGGDEKKFKEANEAYQTLSDPKKRAQYDQFGSAGASFAGGSGPSGFGGMNWEDIMRSASAGGFGGQAGGFNVNFNGEDIDLGDIFGAFGFGGGRSRRGRSVQVETTITFKESVHGAKKTIEVPEFRDGKQQGTKKIDVTIPAGIDDGEQLKMAGGGEVLTDKRPGDLYITVRVTPHKIFRKEGMHIVIDMNVKLTEAILGAEIEIETLDGTEKIKIPHGMQPGAILRVRGKGVQGGFMQKGDLLIVTHIEIPKHLSKEAKESVERLKKLDY